MKRLGIHLCCVALLTWLPTNPASAAEFDAQQLAAAVGPYVDQETVVVAHIDLARLDVAASIQMVSKFVAPTFPDPEDVERQTKMAEAFVTGFREQLKEAGATRLYVTASIGDITKQKYNLIVPVADDGDHQTIASLLFSGRADGPTTRQQAKDENVPVGNFEVCQRFGNVVFCGSEATVKRLPYSKNMRADQKTLADAFEQAGDSDGQLLILPAEPFRVLREMDPDLPEQLGGLSGEDVADGIQWIAVGINAPPKPSIRLTLQSTDGRAAKILQVAINNGLNLLAAHPEVKAVVPDSMEMMQILIPKRNDSRLVMTIDDASVERVANRLLATMSEPLKLKARQNQAMNRIKMLALAMWNFESTYGSFAPPASYSKEGKPLLSWRVYMLPFLEGNANELYRRFKLNEPWNSPHNRKLISEMPDVFLSKGLGNTREGKTGFVLPVAEGTAFYGEKGTVVQDIKDGTSKTIMIAEAAPEHAVVWTKPTDWSVDFDEPTKGLVSAADEQIMFAFCDGSVQVYPVKIDAKRLRLLILKADAEPVDR